MLCLGYSTGRAQSCFLTIPYIIIATYYYNIHVHIHCDCACAFHLRSHVGRDAPPSATRIIPRGTMRAAAHRGSWVKCVAGQYISLDFLTLAFVNIYMQNESKCSIQVAHLFVAFCCLFHPHTHINEGDGARGATAPLAWGGRGGTPPLAGLFFSVLVNVHMQNWSKLQ